MSTSSLFNRVRSAIPNLLQSPEARNVLMAGARVVKAKFEAFLDAKCPSCGQIAQTAVANPIVKAALEGADTILRRQCPTCGEVLDIIVEA